MFMNRGARSRQKLIGHLDYVRDGVFSGWLYNRDQRDQQLNFELFINGLYQGSVSTGIYRSDLVEAGYGNGCHGFRGRTSDFIHHQIDNFEITFFVPKLAYSHYRFAGSGAAVACEGNIPNSAAGFWNKLADTTINPTIKKSETSIMPTKQKEFIDFYRRKHSEKNSICNYVAFLKSKYAEVAKLSEQSFYRWYFEEYFYSQGEKFKIILSDAEVENISRSFIEQYGCEVPSGSLISRFKYTLLKKRHMKRRYYWWQIVESRRLNIDCLVNQCNDRELLRTERNNGGLTTDYPLNDFLVLFAKYFYIWNPFLEYSKSYRIELYEKALLYSRRNNHIIKYIPHFWAGQILNAVTGPGQLAETARVECETAEDFSENYTGCDLQLIGPFNKTLGLGESVRRVAAVLMRTNLTVNFVDHDLRNGSQAIEKVFPTRKNVSSRINIFHLNAEEIPELIVNQAWPFSADINVIIPYWELSKLSTCHKIGVAIFDEIWAPSSFVANVFHECGIDTFKLGMIARSFDLNNGNQLSSSTETKNFVFLTTFDALSWVQRKNTLEVVRTFKKAFQQNEGVSLVIKTQNFELSTKGGGNTAFDRLLKEADDHRISIISATLSETEHRALIARANCLVSLHRAEGLGLDLIDALASGIPLVTTAYSGNMDFCNEDNCWLVDYRLVNVNQQDYAFVESGQEWAEVDHVSAVANLRGVYLLQRERELKSARGIDFIKNHASIELLAKAVHSHLISLMKVKIDH